VRVDVAERVTPLLGAAVAVVAAVGRAEDECATLPLAVGEAKADAVAASGLALAATDGLIVGEYVPGAGDVDAVDDALGVEPKEGMGTLAAGEHDVVPDGLALPVDECDGDVVCVIQLALAVAVGDGDTVNVVDTVDEDVRAADPDGELEDVGVSDERPDPLGLPDGVRVRDDPPERVAAGLAVAEGDPEVVAELGV
jgi:hypothetical protein